MNPGPSTSAWRDTVATTLGSGNLRDALRLPMGENRNEWLAVNLMDLVNQVRMMYGVVYGEQCNSQTCTTMSTFGREYVWGFDEKELHTTAPTYVDLTLKGCQMMMDDEQIFPSVIGKNFPPDFDEVCKKMMRRLFRVYAHVYHSHEDYFKSLRAYAHLNTSFKQFIIFAAQFNLIDEEELTPLRHIIDEVIGLV